MRQSRSSVNAEIQASKKPAVNTSLLTRFEDIIEKQREIIQSLSSEILLLKSYISLDKATQPFESNCSDISLNSTSLCSTEEQIRGELEESINCHHKKYEKFVKQISSALQIVGNQMNDEDVLVESIGNLKRELEKRRQPIFVERIKETKVPIIVEKTVEKIVYVDRQSKVDEKKSSKQAFREKIVEKKNQESLEESSNQLNKTYSERNLWQRRDEDRGYEQNYEDRPRYDPYRKGQAGSNLVRKRGDNSRHYYKKY